MNENVVLFLHEMVSGLRILFSQLSPKIVYFQLCNDLYFFWPLVLYSNSISFGNIFLCISYFFQNE
jgi:hypothetical protein